MTQITPIVFPILGTANELLVRILSFEADAPTATTYYELVEQIETTVDGNVSISTKPLANGNYTLTEAQFAAWGEDNAYVVQCVADHLGVTIVTE
jgi:hypothetical protein